MSFRSYRRNVMEEIQRAEQRALTKVGLYVQGEATSRSPVVSGRLKNSWDYETSENSVTIGNNVEYAPFVEFGTSKQRAQRVLTGSVEENKANIQRIINSELNRVGE